MAEENINNGTGDILLLSMPFPLPCSPSIQLGSLSAYLASRSIPVRVCHAYLSCADILDVELYCSISDRVPDEVFYPHFLFSEHARSHRKAVTKYLARIIGRVPSLDAILTKLNVFNESLLVELDMDNTSIVGFTVTYDQLRPSLYLAKRMKERNPGLKIVFGGALCTGEMGTSLLASFPQVDFVIAGEGERSLAALCENLITGQVENIPGLARRRDGAVTANPPAKGMALEALPVPDYSEFFARLAHCSPETRAVVNSYLSVPVEGSRGCWWRKCTFCNLNVQYEHYHCKPVKQVVGEVQTLVNRHHCHTIGFVDNVQRIQGFRDLMVGLIDLQQDLDIFMEIRAGCLERSDFSLMRDAGVKLAQIGVEALSKSMLRKINKGVATIENIAAIKYCQEFGIYAYYNIIIDYPNEEPIDLQETETNIRFLSGLMPPSSILPMWLGIGSPIYVSPRDFNVNSIERQDTAFWLFPEKVWETLTPLRYAYTRISKTPDRSTAWRTMFVPWQRHTEELIMKPLLFCQGTDTFTTITDMRSGHSTRTTLSGIEHELYTFCYDIRTRKAIDQRFADTPTSAVTRALKRFSQERWMFEEDGAYLGLAVHLNPGLSPLLYRAAAGPDIDPALDGIHPPVRQRHIGFHLGSLADVELSVSLNRMPGWLQRIRSPTKP